jgi:serine/threonine-protein kinase
MAYKQPWSYDADRSHIFVCYSHADRSAVLQQIRELHDEGFNIWYDEGMHAGSEWPEELANAISGCECLLYFVTPASVATRNCRDEVQFARDHDKRIVVVHMEETVLPPALALSLGSTHALMRYNLDAETYRRRLASSLREEAGDWSGGTIWTPRNKERAWWLGGVLAALSALALFMVATQPSVDRSIHFAIRIPEALDLTPPRYEELQHASPIALAPQGDSIIFSARDNDGTYRLYERRLNSQDIREIPGTEDATAPFVSPDGQWVGFVRDRELLKTSLIDGTVQTIVSALPGEGFGGASWGDNDVIVYTPSAVSGTYQVPAEGGASVPLSTPGGNEELTHIAPDFIAGSSHALVSVRSGMLPEPPSIDLLDLSNGQKTRLIEGATGGRYANGMIYYGRAGTETGLVWAQEFNPRSLALGEQVYQVIDAVASDLYSMGFFDVSESGDVAWIPPASTAPQDRLLLRDSGGISELLVLEGNIINPAVSPDGRSILLTTLDERRRMRVWQFDLDRQVLNPILPLGIQAHLTVWLPDGSGFIATTNQDGPSNLYLVNLQTNAAPHRLTENENHQDAASFSNDGKTLSYAEIDPETNWDLWLLDMETLESRPFLATTSEEIQPIISPSGLHIAYTSNETGSRQVYLQNFPQGGGKQMISLQGGEDPLWSGDGRQLSLRSTGKTAFGFPNRNPSTRENSKAGPATENPTGTCFRVAKASSSAASVH